MTKMNEKNQRKAVWTKPVVKSVTGVRKTRSGLLLNAGFENSPVYNLS